VVGSDELLTIAEISIGIAGFSGVVAAFLQREQLHQLDQARFINLFVVAFSTLFLAFVPISFWHAGFSGIALWRWSSAAMLVVWLMNTGIMIFFVYPVIRQHIPVNARRIPSSVVAVPSTLNVLLQTLNLTGWLWEPAFLAFLFGLFIYLYSAAALFVYIVIYRPPAASRQPPDKPLPRARSRLGVGKRGTMRTLLVS
jgi:hypothetical protein